MQKYRALFAISFLALAILAVGCGPTEQAQDPQVLDQRAQYVLAEEPKGAMSIVAAKAAVEKGEPVVLVGRISAGEHEPWDEGHAAFYIADAFSPTPTSHGHDDAKHVHEGDEADEHEADEHEADEHEADEHEADEHEADEHEADEHEADEHEADEHEADEHEGHAHESHGAGGHDHNCPFCRPAKDSEDLYAIVEFVDATGHRLHADARDLLGVKKDQAVVIRGKGRVESDGYLVVTADGIYLRD